MKKTLFTDLDGTILFSKNSLPADLAISDCEMVEVYSNGNGGYMERQLIHYLTDWSKENTFIPVTTRSIEQYQRLTAGFQQFNCSYALVSNGGNLYRNGILDLNWSQNIRLALATELAQKDKILAILSKLLQPDWLRKIKWLDEFYFCFLVIERAWEPELILAVNRQLEPLNWHAYFQHKKLYVLPIALSKEAAIAKLKAEWTTKKSKTRYLAMGDTTMDSHFLTQQDAYLYFGAFNSEAAKLTTSSYSFTGIQRFLE